MERLSLPSCLMNITVGLQTLAFPIEGRKQEESFVQVSINGEQISILISADRLGGLFFH